MMPPGRSNQIRWTSVVPGTDVGIAVRERMYRVVGGGRNLLGTRAGIESLETENLQLLELRVAFYKFFGAAAWEGHGKAAVFFVAFNSDDGADSVFGVT